MGRRSSLHQAARPGGGFRRADKRCPERAAANPRDRSTSTSHRRGDPVVPGGRPLPPRLYQASSIAVGASCLPIRSPSSAIASDRWSPRFRRIVTTKGSTHTKKEAFPPSALLCLLSVVLMHFVVDRTATSPSVGIAMPPTRSRGLSPYIHSRFLRTEPHPRFTKIHFAVLLPCTRPCLQRAHSACMIEILRLDSSLQVRLSTSALVLITLVFGR